MSLSNEEIVEMLKDFDEDSKALKKIILKLCWHMRGGLTYDEAMIMGYQDRQLVNELIEENLEITKETKLPFF